MAATPDLRRGFEFGPFTIIPERGIVRRDGEDVHLEPKQMDALVTLARHQPGVVSKDLLVEEVWGGRATADESIVQCIKGIRQALDKDDPRDPKYVETIHGRGYRLMCKFPKRGGLAGRQRYWYSPMFGASVTRPLVPMPALIL
jgi:DNA-binding winged helix-turn-helix (wHTH) protein